MQSITPDTHPGEYARWIRCSEGRVSFVGDLIGIKTTNESTIWVHASDIKGVEELPNRPYEAKLFIQGKTSPIFAVVDIMHLGSAITNIRRQTH